MLDKFKTLWNFSKEKYSHVYAHFHDAKTTLSNSEHTQDMNELADALFVLKDVERELDDMRKEFGKEIRKLEGTLCILYTKHAAGNQQIGVSIKTDYCTATPDVKMCVSYPKKSHDPEKYSSFMADMGVPSELIGDNPTESELMRPHWPGMVEEISRRVKLGIPLPAGIDPTALYPIYKVTVRRRKNEVADKMNKSNRNIAKK